MNPEPAGTRCMCRARCAGTWSHGTLVGVLWAAAQLWPAAAHPQPAVEIEFVRSFGMLGNQPGEFNFFGGVTVDNDGLIYLTDNGNHRIQICDYQGNCEADGQHGSFPAPPGQFQFPIGIALDQDGRIVVSDGQNMRIQIRDLQGAWSTFGSGGPLPGQFSIPGGLAVDAQNRIVIADENNERVQSCDDQGNCSVIATGFDTPRAVAFDSLGRVVISDRFTNRIHICVPNGPCTQFGSTGSDPGQFRAPTQVWVDGANRIFVTDRDNNRFQVCDLQGACVAFGGPGAGPGQFNHPTAVAVDEQDRIIIGDSDNNRIQIFQATFGDAAGFTINSGLNDAWLNPDTAGQGFLIVVLPEAGIVFLAWFTYDTELPPEEAVANLGWSGHRWLTAQGPYDRDTAVLEVFLTEGGVFDSAEPPAVTHVDDPIGFITIVWRDCNHALLAYEIDPPGVMGQMEITRIVPDNVAVCEALGDP